MPISRIDPVMLTAAFHSVNGHADPETLAAATQAANGDPGKTVENTRAIVHSSNMVQYADFLKSMPVADQMATWGGFHPAERRSLQSLGYRPPQGYTPPTATVTGGGGIGGFLSDVGKGIESTFTPTIHVAERAPGAALNALGYPLRAVQHLERASHALSEYGVAATEGWNKAYQESTGGPGHGIFDMNAFHDIFSPSAWAHAWDETNNGNTYLDPAINHHLVSQYGQAAVSTAIRIDNMGPDAYVQSLPQSQRLQITQHLQDPKFQKLLQEVSTGKMSLGRSLVGQQFMLQHPLEGKVLSGGVDAANDILSDPTMKAGKIAEALKIARFGAVNATAAQNLVRNSPDAQRYIGYVAKNYLSKGDYAGMAKFDPRLNNIAEDLSTRNITDAQGFTDYLTSRKGIAAIMGGKVSKESHGVMLVPHMTHFDMMKAPVKKLLTISMNALADGKYEPLPQEYDSVVQALQNGIEVGKPGNIDGLNVPRYIARLSRSLVTNVPSRGYLTTAEGHGDVANFRQSLQDVFHEKDVNNLTNLYIHATEGQRRLLISATEQQRLHAYGLYNSEEGAKAANKLTEEALYEARNQAYSVNGYDAIRGDDGLVQHHALLSTQLAGGMSINTPAELRKLVRDNGILGAFHLNPVSWAESLMKLWRTSLLARPGFAIRIGLEENMGRFMRGNPLAIIGSMIANGVTRTRSDKDIFAEVEKLVTDGKISRAAAPARIAALQAQAIKSLTPYHPIQRALNMLVDRVPLKYRQNIKDVNSLYAHLTAANTRKWLRGAQKSALKQMSMQDLIDGAQHLADHQPVANDMLQDLLASTTGAEGFTLTPGAMAKSVRDGATGKMAKMIQHGAYRSVDSGDHLFRYRWQFALDQIAHDPAGRAVLHSMDLSRNDQVESVLHVLHGMPDVARDRFAFANALNDGSVVGTNVSKQEAMHNWANMIVNHVNSLVRSGEYFPLRHESSGPILRDLVNKMVETGSAPSNTDLEAVIQHQLPQTVFGPDMLQVHGGGIGALLSKTMEEVAGKPMNWLTRMPHMIHKYTEGLVDAQRAARHFGMVDQSGKLTEGGEQYASDIAFNRAYHTMVPYIHDPALRTQFEDHHRILFPFLFAQRQFLLRWGRTMTEYPSTVRKFQLGYNGLLSTGLLQSDGTFNYFGSQYVTELIARTLNAVGVHTTIPYAVPFTGQIKEVVPGLNNPITPSTGPFASFSLKEMAKVFPEMEGFNNAVLGQGANVSAVHEFLPSVVNRLYDALGPVNAGSELASATGMAMKYMDANGQGLPQNANAMQTQLYLSHLQNFAHSILLTRAALGFLLPASPKAQLDPAGLDSRFKKLLDTLPYDQAIGEFMKEHPNASAYTIGETEAQTSGNIPSTAADLAYTNANIGFAKQYPAAFPWLAPRSPGTFSITEFQEQLDTGQRKSLPIYDDQGGKSILTDIMNAQAASIYYQNVDSFSKWYESTGSGEHAAGVAQYDKWKQEFMQVHPVFKLYLESQQGKRDRERTLQEVQTALQDPNLPSSPATQGLEDMVSTYQEFRQAYINAGTYTAKTDVKQSVINWGNDYVQSDPKVADFWNTILRPQIAESTGSDVG